MGTNLTNAPEVQPSRPSHLRYANCRTLLALLRANNPCSRADLVRRSGLSAPTVTAAIGDLEAMGLVEMIGEGQSSGGRPPELLRFRSEHGYVAGVDIGGTRLRMMLTNLNGDPVAHWKTTLHPDSKDPESVCKLVREGMHAMCGEAGIRLSRVLHLTVGAPGITDVNQGIVLYAPNLTNWNNVPLRSLLRRELQTEVLAENDTNLAAVGEHWRGSAHGIHDFVFIAMGTGVGSGVFLRGQLHHGAAWTAGEIGYLGVPGMPREPLAMSRAGQLERVIGGEGIEKEWRRRLQEANRDTDASLLQLRAPHILDLVSQNDPQAIAVLNHVAAILADAIATITVLFNPELVVMGGGIGAHPALCQATEKLLSASDFPHPSLRSSILGTEAQLFGAVSLSLAAVESRLVVQV